MRLKPFWTLLIFLAIGQTALAETGVVEVQKLLQKGNYAMSGEFILGGFTEEPDCNVRESFNEKFISVPVDVNYNSLIDENWQWYVFCLELEFDRQIPENLYLELSGTTARYKLYIDGQLVDDRTQLVDAARDEREIFLADTFLNPGYSHKVLVVCYNDETARKQRFFYQGPPLLRLSSDLYRTKTLQAIVNVSFIIVYGLGSLFFLLVYYQYREDYGLLVLAMISLVACGYYLVKMYTAQSMDGSLYIFMKRIQYTFLFVVPSLFLLYITLLRYRNTSRWQHVFMLSMVFFAGLGGFVPFAITNIANQHSLLKGIFVVVWGVGFAGGLLFMASEVQRKIRAIMAGRLVISDSVLIGEYTYITLFIVSIIVALSICYDLYYFVKMSYPPRVIGFSLGLYYVVIAGMFSGRFVRLCREYAEKNRELIRRNRQKDEFLANTSHELKTPLNGIIGIAESMLDGAGGVLEKDVGAEVQGIARSGRRLEAIVNSLLDLVCLKNDEIQLQKSPCDLAAMMDIVARISSGGQDAEGGLVNSLYGTSFVLADESRLIQVLMSVFAYMKTGWSGRIVVSGYEAGGIMHVMIKREDQGQTAEQKSAPGDKQVSGSLRVELELAREIFRLHGGLFNLDWDSVLNPEVVFTLPVVPQEDMPVVPEDKHGEELAHFVPLASEGHDKEYMIIVVDDDPVNLHVVRTQLENDGMFVVTIQDSREVSKIIEKGVFPDLLILDVMMPYVSGFEICRSLRERYSLTELPVLMLTARNRTADVLASFQAGANDFIAKPFEVPELRARVRRLLALKETISTESQYIRLQNEMNLAVRIQQAIMPEQLPEIEGLESHCLYRPFSALGGDFLDYMRDDQGIGIIIADVAGHGVAASIVAAMVKIAFSGQRAYLKDPSMLMERMNSVLIQNTRNTYVTATYIYIDFSLQNVSVARAGHYPLLVLDKAAATIEEYSGKGRMLGRFKSAGCETVSAPLKAGQRFVLYTDCVLETRSPSGEMIGEERFFDLVADSVQLDPRAFNERTVRVLEQWLGPDEFDDDLTLITIDINTLESPL